MRGAARAGRPSPLLSSQVSLHGGAPNKNIGDAFLLVWKFPEGVEPAAIAAAAAGASLAAAPGPELDARLALDAVCRQADGALASFIIIQAALRRSKRLAELVNRPDVQARLPGFAVRMGFGLHVGWAIEGAIGSEYKVRERGEREGGGRARRRRRRRRSPPPSLLFRSTRPTSPPMSTWPPAWRPPPSSTGCRC